MTNCAYCGKPKYTLGNALTLTAGTTVWPYCQCTVTIRYVISSGTTMAPNWGELPPNASGNGYLYTPPEPYGTSAIEKLQPKQEVPLAFQEAFKDGELDL